MALMIDPLGSGFDFTKPAQKHDYGEAQAEHFTPRPAPKREEPKPVPRDSAQLNGPVRVSTRLAQPVNARRDAAAARNANADPRDEQAGIGCVSGAPLLQVGQRSQQGDGDQRGGDSAMLDLLNVEAELDLETDADEADDTDDANTVNTPNSADNLSASNLSSVASINTDSQFDAAEQTSAASTTRSAVVVPIRPAQPATAGATSTNNQPTSTTSSARTSAANAQQTSFNHQAAMDALVDQLAPLSGDQNAFELLLPDGDRLGVVVIGGQSNRMSLLLSPGSASLRDRLRKQQMELQERLERRMGYGVSLSVL